MATGEVGRVRLGRQHDDLGAHGAAPTSSAGAARRRRPPCGRAAARPRPTAAPASALARRSGWTAAQCGVNSAAAGIGDVAPLAQLGRRQPAQVVLAEAERPGLVDLGRQPGVLGGGAGQRDRAALDDVASRTTSPPAPTSSTVVVHRPLHGDRRRSPVAGGELGQPGRQQRRAPAAVAAAGAEPDVLALEHGDAQRRVGARRGSRPSTGRCSRRRRWPRRRRASPSSGRPRTTSSTGIVAAHSEPGDRRVSSTPRSWQTAATGTLPTRDVDLAGDVSTADEHRSVAPADRLRRPAGTATRPGSPFVRYFDGRRWTDHTAAVGPVPAAGPPGAADGRSPSAPSSCSRCR